MELLLAYKQHYTVVAGGFQSVFELLLFQMEGSAAIDDPLLLILTGTNQKTSITSSRMSRLAQIIIQEGITIVQRS